MRIATRLSCLALAALAGGCDENHYEIEMTPRGNQLQRRLTCWYGTGTGPALPPGPGTGQARQVKPFPAEELAAIAKVYGAKPEQAEPNVHVFQGAFEGATPADVGGAGWYARFDSELGSASIYIERFRGRDDQAGRLDEEFRKADRLVDHLIGWFEKELGKEKGWPKLRQFMDGDLRRDVRNAALTGWGEELLKVRGSGTGDPGKDMFAGLLQYLSERKYFSPADMPTLARALTEATSMERPERLFGFLQRLVASRMGVPADQPVPQSLNFLAGPDQARASLEAYLIATPEYKNRLGEWEQQRRENPQATQPAPTDVLQMPGLFPTPLAEGSTALLHASLATGTPPWLTDGQWDQETRKVSWTAALRKGETIPTLCYALWAEPNEAFQRAHFGRAVLADDDLFQHCLWRKSLSPKEAEEWRAFLAELKPGPGLADQLKAFRFSHEPAPTTAPESQPAKERSYAKAAIDELVSALESQAASQPASGPAEDRKEKD